MTPMLILLALVQIRAFKGAGTEDGMQDDQLHKLGAYVSLKRG